MKLEFRRSLRWSLAAAAIALNFGCNDPGVGGADVAFDEIFDDSEVTIEATAEGERLRMERVIFSTGSNEIIGGDASLAKFAEVFALAPAGRYRIEVHTDDRGSASANLDLSQSRAEAVRDFLIAMAGASPQALAAEGFGGAFPIASNETRTGRAQNRRVEITALNDDGTRAYRVSVAADVLDVVADCDDFTGSPEAAAGDFRVYVGFSIAAEGRTDVAATTGTELIYANAGETIDLDLAAESIYWGTDGARIELDLRWYETDTGGVRQIDYATRRDALRWSNSERCWEYTSGRGIWTCQDATEGEVFARTWSYDSTGSAEHLCIADLDWSITVERVD